MNDFDFITVKEMQKLLGVSRATAYKIAHTPGCPVKRFGRALKISKSELLNWINSTDVIYFEGGNADA